MLTYNADEDTQNTAVLLFEGDGTLRNPSHLAFKTWYHPDICHYLLQMSRNQARCIRVLLPDAGYGNNTRTFKDQLQTLILLSNLMQKNAIFISKEPGADNHFILGLVKGNRLLLVNPVGVTNHHNFYQTLAELQKEKTLDALWLSSQALQKREYEEESLYSCGPITLELAIHILENMTEEQLNQFWDNDLKAQEPTKHDQTGLVYFGTTITSLLSNTLLPLLSSTNHVYYQQQVLALRRRHLDQLKELPLLLALSKELSISNYLKQCQDESPSQVVFNALLTNHKQIYNVEVLPEYELLQDELKNKAPYQKANKEMPAEKTTLSSSSTTPLPEKNTPFLQKEQSEPIVPLMPITILRRPENIDSQKNAIRFFENDNLSGKPSHLQFKASYRSSVFRYLLNTASSGHPTPHTITELHFENLVNTTQDFKSELESFIRYSEHAQRTTFFFCREPGTKNQFVCGWVNKKQLLLINPLGITINDGCYEALAQLQKEKMLETVCLVSDVLQKRDYEGEDLCSSGPIMAELVANIWENLSQKFDTRWSFLKEQQLQETDGPHWDSMDAQFGTFWGDFKKPEPTTHDSTGLIYYSTTIKPFLKTKLLQLLDADNIENYQVQILALRQGHSEQIKKQLPSEPFKTYETLFFLDYLKHRAKKNLPQSYIEALNFHPTTLSFNFSALERLSSNGFLKPFVQRPSPDLDLKQRENPTMSPLFKSTDSNETSIPDEFASLFDNGDNVFTEATKTPSSNNDNPSPEKYRFSLSPALPLFKKVLLGRIEKLLRDAWFFEEIGNHKKAEVAFEAAVGELDFNLDAIQETIPRIVYETVYARYAEYLFRQRKFEKANVYLDSARKFGHIFNCDKKLGFVNFPLSIRDLHKSLVPEYENSKAPNTLAFYLMPSYLEQIEELLELASLREAQQNHQQAKKYFEFAVEQVQHIRTFFNYHAMFAKVYGLYAEYLSRQGDIDRAEQYFNLAREFRYERYTSGSAIKIDPKDITFSGLGDSYRHESQTQEIESLLVLASVYKNQEKYTDIEKVFKWAFKALMGSTLMEHIPSAETHTLFSKICQSYGEHLSTNKEPSEMTQEATEIHLKIAKKFESIQTLKTKPERPFASSFHGYAVKSLQSALFNQMLEDAHETEHAFAAAIKAFDSACEGLIPYGLRNAGHCFYHYRSADEMLADYPLISKIYGLYGEYLLSQGKDIEKAVQYIRISENFGSFQNSTIDEFKNRNLNSEIGSIEFLLTAVSTATPKEEATRLFNQVFELFKRIVHLEGIHGTFAKICGVYGKFLSQQGEEEKAAIYLKAAKKHGYIENSNKKPSLPTASIPANTTSNLYISGEGVKVGISSKPNGKSTLYISGSTVIISSKPNNEPSTVDTPLSHRNISESIIPVMTQPCPTLPSQSLENPRQKVQEWLEKRRLESENNDMTTKKDLDTDSDTNTDDASFRPVTSTSNAANVPNTSMLFSTTCFNTPPQPRTNNASGNFFSADRNLPDQITSILPKQPTMSTEQSKFYKYMLEKPKLLLEQAEKLLLKEIDPATYSEITKAFQAVFKPFIEIPRFSESDTMLAKANGLYAHYLLEQKKPEAAEKYLMKAIHLGYLDRFGVSNIQSSIRDSIEKTLTLITAHQNSKEYSKVKEKIDFVFSQLKKIHHLRDAHSIFSKVYALYGNRLIKQGETAKGQKYLEIARHFEGVQNKIENNPYNSTVMFNKNPTQQQSTQRKKTLQKKILTPTRT